MKKAVSVQSHDRPSKDIDATVPVVNEGNVWRELDLFLANYGNVVKSQTTDFLHSLNKISVVRTHVVALAMPTAGESEAIKQRQLWLNSAANMQKGALITAHCHYPVWSQAIADFGVHAHVAILEQF
jgi:hypothetical protein